MKQKNEAYLLINIMHYFQYLEITLNYAFKRRYQRSYINNDK